jgi:hypothetical protein
MSRGPGLATRPAGRGGARGGRPVRGKGSTNIDETLSPSRSVASEEPQSESAASAALTHETAATRKAPSPRDPAFRQEVLGARGIKVDSTSWSVPGPYTYFEVHEDMEDFDYWSMPELEGVSIWLDTRDEFLVRIEREYDCMTQRGLCEAEFASYAKENLLIQQPRYVKLPEDRRWRAERMLELVVKPEPNSQWEVPPPLEEDGTVKGYAFDIRPDCSYWLSLQAFNREYLSQVKEYVKVMYRTVACPYFTIEFKRDEDGRTAAENQVAAAGALALYNRYRLKRLGISRRSNTRWRSKDLLHLKHYALTFTGANYTFWCLVPEIDLTHGQWRGCVMKRIFQSDADFKNGVRSLVGWLNEIHFWGLRVYGPACEMDIKTCLRTAGFRVSSVAEAMMADEDSEDRTDPQESANVVE